MSQTESDLELEMPKIDGDSQMTNTNYSKVQMVQNRLGYRMPQKKSLVSKRRHVNNDFDKSVYTSNDSQMQCKINSSTDFICNVVIPGKTNAENSPIPKRAKALLKLIESQHAKPPTVPAKKPKLLSTIK